MARRQGVRIGLLDQHAVLEAIVDLCVGNAVAGVVWTGSQRIELGAVTAAYLRPSELPHLPPLAQAGPGSRSWRHAAAIEDALWSWAELTAARVVDRPAAKAVNHSKPYQVVLDSRRRTGAWAEGTMRTYTVKAGDTLGKIARKFSVSMDGIVRLNNIRNPDRIRVGTALLIPELTTDAMDAVSLPVETPPAPAGETAALPINRSRFVLPSKEFIPEVADKDLIVLHFTAGRNAQGAFNSWMNNPERVATAYVVEMDGTIYEVFDPSYWAFHLGVKGAGGVHDKRSVGIEIVNVGPLKPSASDPNRLDWWPNNWGTPWCRLDETGRYVRSPFRGIDYFASFPEPQFTAVARLTVYLCERFGVPKTIPPRTRRKECDTSYYGTRKGVVGHQNFRADKWDVGPAFDWERLGFYR